MRAYVAMLGVALLMCTTGCFDSGSDPMGPDGSGNSAVITGRIISRDGGSKVAQGCADALVELNGVPASVAFDDDCQFVITGISPTEQLQIRVELPELEVSGIVEVSNVSPGEMIEIEVEATDNRLTVSVVRRVDFEPSDELPGIISNNNVHMLIGSGLFSQDLTVRGNNFGLLGESGGSCDAEGWSVISGDVLVVGNNATFRNIAFDGDVRVMGRNAKFINCCFDGEFMRFGSGRNGG